MTKHFYLIIFILRGFKYINKMCFEEQYIFGRNIVCKNFFWGIVFISSSYYSSFGEGLLTRVK